MFERFSERAWRVVVLAQDEARRFGQREISTEDLLVSLIHDSNSVAGAILESLGVELETARQRADEAVGRGEGEVSGYISFAQPARDVLARALRESEALGHDYVGTEHILLGLIDDAGSDAARVLIGPGVTLEGIRAQVRRLLPSE